MRLDTDLGGPHGVFAWLTRVGLAPKFGKGTPIGFYQHEAINAIDALEDVFGSGANVRLQHGMITDGRFAVDLSSIRSEVGRRFAAKGPEDMQVRAAWAERVRRPIQTRSRRSR